MMLAKQRALRARVWLYVVMVAVIWSFAWGCPSNPVGPGDGGDGIASEGTKSDGVGEPTGEATPEPGREFTPEAGAEPAPEPTQEPTTEPAQETPQEKAPEPRAEPTPEPGLDIASDGGEPVPDSVQEPGAEPVPETSPEPGPDQGPPGIGDPCKVDADCGGSLVCIPEGKPASFPFPQSTGNGPPGGYCTARCIAGGSTPCPQGSECYVPGAASGTCLKTCKADTDCRSGEGYRCANDGGMQDKACFPPTCSLTQPGGNYWMNVTTSSTQGNCSQQPMASGSRIPVSITINAGEITFQFGSKPQSPLPVTWSLVGTYSTTSSIVAANPKGCTQTCDGLLRTTITNPCLFYGSLTSKVDANCIHIYDASFNKRP